MNSALNIHWKVRLEHDRAVRDAYVACGNKAPEEPDPDGGMFSVQVRRYDGKIVRKVLNDRGHDSVDILNCKCRRSGERRA